MKQGEKVVFYGTNCFFGRRYLFFLGGGGIGGTSYPHHHGAGEQVLKKSSTSRQHQGGGGGRRPSCREAAGGRTTAHQHQRASTGAPGAAAPATAHPSARAKKEPRPRPRWRGVGGRPWLLVVVAWRASARRCALVVAAPPCWRARDSSWFCSSSAGVRRNSANCSRKKRSRQRAARAAEVLWKNGRFLKAY